jgi:hypothetical protein
LIERVEIVDEDGQPIERADLEIAPDGDPPAASAGADTAGGDTDDTADDTTDDTDSTDETENDTR